MRNTGKLLDDKLHGLLRMSLKKVIDDRGIRELTEEEKEIINYYGMKKINNEPVKTVKDLTDEELLEFWNVHLPDTLEVLEARHLMEKDYDYKERKMLYDIFKKQVEDEIVRRKLKINV